MVYRAPAWRVLTTALPSCTPLHQLELDQVGPLYECQQIRSYKSTAVILFTEKKSDTVSECSSVPCSHHYHCILQVCTLVTMDIGGTGGSRVRSYYSATSVTDVALYTEPEEIYLMKKNGDVVLYDATNMTEVT